MINSHLSKIKALIVEKEPSLEKHIRTHGGRFDLSELKRYSVYNVSVFVAALSIGTLEKEGLQTKANVMFGIFVMTGGNKDNDRIVQINDLVSALTAHCHGNKFENCEAEASNNLKARNLYSGVLDEKNVAMWAIEFEQKIPIHNKEIETIDWSEDAPLVLNNGAENET